MNLALLKMEVLGTERVERILGKMDIDAAGQGWVVKAMMVSQYGKRQYVVGFL